MAKPEYDNQGNVVKKPFKIKIAGFTFGLGHIILLVLIVGGIMLSSYISSENKKKEDAQRVAERQAELEALKGLGNDRGVLDIHAQIQASLEAQYGVAPEGFEWGYTGELIAIGNDDDHACEDVVYIYLRSLSMLDFSTAGRYSSDSSVITTYQNYYGIISEAITDYYRNFLRKQYKVSLTSLEVTGISDVAVFPDGTEYLTIDIKVLDLTDKDFWREDRDEMFSMMRVYKETEDDTTKLEQYVYDYIYNKYEEGAISKKSYTIELVVEKQHEKGWLVTGDNELNAYLQYERGVDVAKYILADFNEWYMNITIQEQLDQIGGLTTSGGGESGSGETGYDTGDGEIDYNVDPEEGMFIATEVEPDADDEG